MEQSKITRRRTHDKRAYAVSQSRSLKEYFVLLKHIDIMRGSRGAWMRFPDVCVVPISFNERISISHGVPTAGEEEKRMVSYRWIHTQRINPPGILDLLCM